MGGWIVSTNRPDVAHSRRLLTGIQIVDGDRHKVIPHLNHQGGLCLECQPQVRELVFQTVYLLC